MPPNFTSAPRRRRTDPRRRQRYRRYHRHQRAARFTPNIVNIMTMDYGTSGTEMGSAANQALDASASQLEGIYGISSGAAYAMLGNTPMIGQNDSSGEIFTLADASAVESNAAQQGIAMLSFWAEGRDNGGNWTASQWNYDETPGGSSGAWNSDGAC